MNKRIRASILAVVATVAVSGVVASATVGTAEAGGKVSAQRIR